jgi:hypothetical protein
MSVSFAQEADLLCPRCGQSFRADVWLIVDAAERPDLLERVRAGTLHTLSCPHCGHEGGIDVPVLIFRPYPTPGRGEDFPLLFSPAQHTSSEEDQQQAAVLLETLRRRLGDRWRDEWLARGLPGVPRPLLPVVLSEGPEAALLMAFIQARTWDESRRILEAHPELLSDEADALLGRLIEAARAQGDEDARRALEERRALLRRCREVGVEQAFAEKVPGSSEEFSRLFQLQQRAENAPQLWPSVIRGWEEFLQRPDIRSDAPLYAAAQGNLANACLRVYEITGEEIWAQRAEAGLTAVLSIFRREVAPADWAMTQHNLGSLYLSRYERSGEEADARTADEHFRNALEVRRREVAPAQWATTQHNLGTCT